MRKYFTLIELLIVVAVIGILTSILLPSLQKSKHYSVQAVCMSNQAQLARATLLYTSDNSGRLMPVNRVSAYEAIDPLDSFFMHYQDRNNLGYLYTESYLTDSKVFYCPGIRITDEEIRPSASSTPVDGIKDIFTWEYYNELFNGYPSTEELPNLNTNYTGRVRSSYYFNPEGKIKTYKLIQEMDTESILTSDLLMNNFTSHSPLGNRWLVAKSDGAVKAVTSDKVKKRLYSGSDHHFVWSNFNLLFEDLLEASSR